MEKNNKFSAVLITAIVLVLLFGGVLFIFNKQGYLSFSGNETKVINDVDNTVLDKSKENCNVIDLSKLNNFKNYDGTYGTIDSIRQIPEGQEYDYNVSLSLDGLVYVYDFDNGKGHDISITNIIQISSSDAETVYLLDNTNQVYAYYLTNFAKGDYNAVKVDNANNVVKLLSINYGPIENAGGANATIGIKPDGSYVTLDTFRR